MPKFHFSPKFHNSWYNRNYGQGKCPISLPYLLEDVIFHMAFSGRVESRRRSRSCHWSV